MRGPTSSGNCTTGGEDRTTCLCDVDGDVFSWAVAILHRQQWKFRRRQDIRNNRTDTYCDAPW